MHTLDWSPSLTQTADQLLVDDEDMAEFEAVLKRAKAAFAPHAWVRSVEIEALGDDFVLISGEWFEGQPLSGVLSGATRAWAYAATAGEDPILATDGVLNSWWLRMLGDDAVQSMERHLIHSLSPRDGERVAAVSPGSLLDFPITARKPLFRLLGADSVDIALTDDHLITPRASICGILFSSPHASCSCTHCGKGECPKRH